MSIRVSKNGSSILPRTEKMFDIFVFLYTDARDTLSITVAKQNAKEPLQKFRAFLTQIPWIPGLKGYQGTFYPGLRKIYRLSGVRNLKSLLLSVPRELRVRRAGKYIARKSGFSAAFFLSYPGNKFSSRPATSWNSGTML